MKVLGLIKSHGIYHARATYCFQAFGWNFPKCTETRKGVYVFVSMGGDILKIGKADGRGGIARRLNEYRSMTGVSLTKPGTSASVIKSVQETANRLPEMDIYYIPIDSVICTVAGVEMMTTPAREFEQALRDMARQEGHALKFSPNR